MTAMIDPSQTILYRISSDRGGKLAVSLRADGFAARVSIVDSQGAPLVQSDGPAPGGGDEVIDLHVPAGDDLVEVQSLGGGGSYEITAVLTPSQPPFQTVASQFPGYSPLAAVDVNGDGVPDLVVPDGIHLGIGDGTFNDVVSGTALAQDGWSISAIATGHFSSGGLPDLAVAETSPDGITADIRVLRNVGAGEFQLVDAFAVDSLPVAVQVIDFGNGIQDLAVADNGTGNVAIFVGDGTGRFSPGPILLGGPGVIAMAAGRLGDGHVDLIVADQGDTSTGSGQGLRVFQDDGPGQFHQAAAIAVGSGPSAVVAADFNGDGSLDLAVAGADSSDVSVLLNKGDGTFSPPLSYPVGLLPLSLVALDFGAGRIGLATANQNPGDVSVLMGNGDGTFKPQTRFGVGSFPGAVVAADLNGDHRLDLAVANLGSQDISVLLGRGDGTFQDQQANPVGNGPHAAVTADLNHDGHVDLIAADYYSNDISVLMGQGDGTFKLALSFPTGEHPTALVLGDFNGDGRLDVAVAGGRSSGNGQGVAILLGNGDGTFQSPRFYAAGVSPAAIVAVDFNGDGVLDLAVANRDSGDVSILTGDGRGGFSAAVTANLGDLGSEPTAIAAGHFTGPGRLELAVLAQGGNAVLILGQDNLGEFQVLARISLGVEGSPAIPQALVAGDFNGDGADDVAIVSAGSAGAGFVSVILGSAQGSFNLLPPVSMGSNLNPVAIIAAHLFGGGPLDLAIAENYSQSVFLLKGDGLGGFPLQRVLNLANQNLGALQAIAAGDFTGRGGTDLAIAGQAPNSLAIELNKGSGEFAPPGSGGLAPRATPLVADLNGDGVLDVSVVDGAGDILFRQGQPGQPGSFDPPITINSGSPSRDIAVITTSRGKLLASVDATDNAVSLFAYVDGRFARVGSVATGQSPAQILAADFTGSGQDDLLIRNAGEGTLTLDRSLGGGWFGPPIELATGPGISDVSLADVNQDGRPDILLANQMSGTVEVMLKQGGAGFSPATFYRAGTGLAGLTGGFDTTPLAVLSGEQTAGVVAGPLTRGEPPNLVALNPGAGTLGILTGLGEGRFANPTALSTAGPISAARIADINGDGNPDLVTLGSDGLTVWLGDGLGGILPSAPYDVGPDPTGLTIADLNGDKLPDLAVGNAFGDVLLLMGNRQGVFQPPVLTDRGVGLAVAHFNGESAPSLIFANQSLDRVVVQNGSQAQPTVLGDRTSGLLAPGGPITADLNGDGIPDLIVANSGGNNVLVYPGLQGGGFGPPVSLSNGNGLFTGTNPVAVIAAEVNADGRPDLIVANKGSNNVSVLINESGTNRFAFVPGPRLHVGAGPVALAYGDVNGDGIPDILVSDSASRDVMVLPGRGDGFFNDVNPMVFPLSAMPGPVFVGDFGGQTGPDIVVLNPVADQITMISSLQTAVPSFRVFSSGGLDPVAAVSVPDSNGFDDLIVANHADGSVAFLAGGSEGLTLEAVSHLSDFPSPTALAVASFQNGILAVYAASEGEEAATLLEFSMGGSATGASTGGSQGITLIPSRDSSLPLIATLLIPYAGFNAEEGQPQELPGTATAVTELVARAAGFPGQRLPADAADPDLEGDAGEVLSPGDPDPSALDDASGAMPWTRAVFGLDHAFDEFRRRSRDETPSDNPGPPEGDSRTEPPTPGPPEFSLDSATRNGETRRAEVIDAAIESLVEGPEPSRAITGSGRDGAGPEMDTRRDSSSTEPIVVSILLGSLLPALVPPVALDRSKHSRRAVLTFRHQH